MLGTTARTAVALALLGSMLACSPSAAPTQEVELTARLSPRDLNSYRVGLVSLDAEELEAVSTRTLGHYQASAQAFWEGTRDHDVSQNLDALLRPLSFVV